MKRSLFALFVQVTVGHVINDYGISIESRSDSANLTQRGNLCGPANGNAVCDQSQCCAPDGTCGVGGYYCFAPACLFPYGPACDANQIPPGTNTSSLPRPQFGNVPYGVSVTHCKLPGKVALTFDDGPWIYTNDLLDLLSKNNVKATFFQVANNNGKGQIENSSTPWPTIMHRIINEGHQLASHTWSHQDLSTLTAQQISDQVIKNEIAFSDVLGFFPTYLRPPYESCTSTCQGILGNLGYHIMNYDLDTLDWQENYANSKSIFSSAINGGNPSTNSYISLTHDIHHDTVYSFAQWMIDTLKAKGYTTATVGECLDDPRSNWYRDAKTGQAWSGSLAGGSSASSSQPSPSSSQAPSLTSSATPSSSTSAQTTAKAPMSSSVTSQQSSSATTTTRAIGAVNAGSNAASSSMSSQSATSVVSAGCNGGMGGCIYQGLGGASASTTGATNATISSQSLTPSASKPVAGGADSLTGSFVAVFLSAVAVFSVVV